MRRPLDRAIMGAALVVAGATAGCQPATAEPAHRSLDVAPSVNPELAEHSKLFEQKIYRVSDNVYSAVGWGLANLIMVEGPGGIVIVDTGESAEQAAAVMREFRKITQKSVVAVILTHHHADHVYGTAAVVSRQDIQARHVPIIAHASLMKEFLQENLTIAPVMAARGASMYNALLRGAEIKDMNSGIGPFIREQTPAFVPPTRTFDDKLDITLAGVPMQLRYVPSEADSEIAIFLPQNKVLLSAEVIQDHTFPNLYTLRGAKFRNPVSWYTSIDKLREFPAEFLVPQHGPPLSGSAEVAMVLRNYRDAIQYVHDQTIRYVNQGLAPAQIVERVHLPPHLAEVRPWLGEFYGSVSHSVPAIYDGYVGWFDGDPVALQAHPRAEASRRYVALMGGRASVLKEARRAYDGADYSWAAELSTKLIENDARDMEARHIKAAAFRRMGYATINANWRGLYLTAADVLDGKMNFPEAIRQNGYGAAMGIDDHLPLSAMLQTLKTRLKAERALDVEAAIGLRMTDTRQTYTLTVRRGILETREGLPSPSGTSAVLEAKAADMQRLIAGTEPLAHAFESHAVRVIQGDVATAAAVMDLFEQTVPVPQVFVR